MYHSGNGGFEWVLILPIIFARSIEKGVFFYFWCLDRSFFLKKELRLLKTAPAGIVVKSFHRFK